MVAATQKTHRPKRLTTHRWNLHQQKSKLAQARLTDQDRENGYTVVRVPPICREPFMAVLTILEAYHRWHARRETSHLLDAAFLTWATWTTRLGAAIFRVLEQRPATLPADPPELLFHTVESIGRPHGHA